MSDKQEILDRLNDLRQALEQRLKPSFYSNKVGLDLKTRSIRANIGEVFSEFDSVFSSLPAIETLLNSLEQLKNGIREFGESEKLSLSNPERSLIDTGILTTNSYLSNYITTVQEKLSRVAEHQKKKYSDVKITAWELSFIILKLSEYGVISNSHVSESKKAELFSQLTNFSSESLRQKISGEYKSNHSLLSLKADNLYKLKDILQRMIDDLEV